MANKKIQTKKVNASDMLFLAVLTFLCQMIEPIFHYMIKWTPLIDNVPLGDMWWTLILRLLCCTAWGLAVYIVIRVSRGCGFDPIKTTGKLTALQWIMTAAVAFVFISVMVVLDGGIKEAFEGLIELKSPVYTVSRFVFEAFQVAVIVLVLSLGQKWGDLLVKKGNKFIPFGGIVLGVCMMLVNIITGGFSLTALIILGIQLIYGMIFVFAGKNSPIAAPFIYLMFVMM